jgi:glucose-6-phosphate 1-epimerase
MYTLNGKSYTSVSAGYKGELSTLRIANTHCKAELSLFGGHLLSFIPNVDGRERLWVSELAIFDKSKPIRGGVPICWPWFGPKYPESKRKEDNKVPAHGFVRTQEWNVTDIEESPEYTQIRLTPSSMGLYSFPSTLELSIELKFADTCIIKLITKNTGDEPETITAALHSYFDITDIRQTEILGVKGNYIDQTQSDAIVEQNKPYTVDCETDRIHLQDASNLYQSIRLQAPNPINIEQEGHDSVVIWNPWQEKSTTMPDMADDGYLTMLCIEASITQGIEIGAYQEHELMQCIS